LSFWENSKSLLLVYRNMAQQSLSDTVNIMLSPQFYTLKKETLPLKYAFQAKKIAPSLFDGLLENTENYDYFVYRKEEVWVFIAYNPEVINHFLVSKGIRSEQVGKIFFAQQALDVLTAPVLLGAKDALAVIDGSVVLIPQSALQEGTETLTPDEHFAPKHGVMLQGAFNSLLTKKQAITLAALFTFFALAFFVEGWRYSQKSEVTKAEIEALIEKYPTLQSQYARKSIAEKYRAIDKNERKKRDTVKTLGEMIFKGVAVDTFKMDDKGFSVRFKCSDAKVAKHLKELSKKESFPSVKTLTNNIVQIGGKL